MPYFLRRQDWTTCTRPAYGGGLPFVPVFYGTSENMPSTYPIDLYVDVMFLTGQVALINTDGGIVPVGGATQYTALSGDEEITAYHYDFNADGTRDTAVAGTWKTVTVEGVTGEAFVPQGSQYWSAGDEVTHFGIYFDAAALATSPPDLIRIADQQKRLNERAGELSSISADDFKNTDILIFRESTGDLIVERRGLRDAEIAGRPQTGFDDGEQLFSYRVMLRGPRDSDLNIGAIARIGRTYEQFTSEYRMEAPFQQREANHPKAGEYVKVVAINRATGYTGTARARLAAAGEGGYNDLSIPVPPILMRPPNLKVWAERDYTVEQGLTRDEQRNYLIGNEGAATLDDEKIVIYTEWLDHDGSALPKDLGRGDGEQFGLTGRLAKIVAPNTLGDAAQAAGGAQALFPIAPGRRTQAIRISDNLTTAEHFYIHVTGEQKAETPSFDVNGSAAPPYDNRPATLTPFLTPLYNEGEHWLTYNEYRRAKDNHTGAGPAPEKPLPSYAWQYRPEYQFSQYGLEMQAINRIQANSDGSTTATNILNLTSPVLASSDALIEALYSLFASGFERLTPIDGEQQLILALGEEESLITVGSDQTITFSNLDSLAGLSPEDYLSMRLYTNNDAGNILWEWAFEAVALTPNPAGVREIEVSADERTTSFNVVFLGYSNRDPAQQDVKSVGWSINGNTGFFTPPRETGRRGSFSSRLSTTPLAGSQAYIVVDTGNGNTLRGPLVKVVPGKPDQIAVTQTGSATIDGIGQINLAITVRDQHGNNVADGTAVSVDFSSDVAIDSPQVTTNGQLNVAVRGVYTAGDKALTIRAGDVAVQRVVTIDDVNVAIAMPATITPDSVVPVTVTAISDGHNLDGRRIVLRTSKGSLQSNELVLSGGSATTNFAAEEITGSGLLTAKFESVTAVSPFEIEYPSGGSFSLAEPVLVGDQLTDGVVPIDRGDGTTFDAPYVVSTEVALQGTPGETETITIGDLANPPIEPVLYYNLNRVYSNSVVGDAYELIDGVGNDLIQHPESEQGFKGSVEFTNESSITIPAHAGLRKTGSIGFGVSVKPSAAGTLIDFPASGQSATLLSSGRIRYQITTANGTFSVESDPVALDEWHRIGARYHNGVIDLEVDGQRYSATATGNLITSGTSEAVQIGNGFEGLMNDFRIIDWSYPLLATLPNGDFRMDVTFASATETVTIASTNQLGNRPIGYAYNQPGYGLIPQAYAGDVLNRWMGEVKFQTEAVSYALVETAKWSADAAEGFSRGLILGDTSTTAGIIGDVAMGFIPFGDTRDIAVLSTRPNQLLSVIEGPFFDHWLKIVDIKEQKIGVLTPDFLQK